VSDVPAALRLLEEAKTVPFHGWDFSVLGDRLVLEPPAWRFEEIVDHLAATATSMLDMGTGGGEWLGARRHPSRTVATESWPPNVPLAAARLAPLGIPVVHDEGAVDNVDQRPGREDGRLAFRDGSFDLVVNRHEAFVAGEVHRVVQPGGTFVTQQATSGSQQFHELVGLDPPAVEEVGLELLVAQLEATGFVVTRAEVGSATAVFADVGALAWYLHNVPWAVPGFDIDQHRDALLALHGQPIRVTSPRLLVQVAR
jgi:SAM-dependent methyltransferase